MSVSIFDSTEDKITLLSVQLPSRLYCKVSGKLLYECLHFICSVTLQFSERDKRQRAYVHSHWRLTCEAQTVLSPGFSRTPMGFPLSSLRWRFQTQSVLHLQPGSWRQETTVQLEMGGWNVIPRRIFPSFGIEHSDHFDLVRDHLFKIFSPRVLILCRNGILKVWFWKTSRIMLLLFTTCKEINDWLSALKVIFYIHTGKVGLALSK